MAYMKEAFKSWHLTVGLIPKLKQLLQIKRLKAEHSGAIPFFATQFDPFASLPDLYSPSTKIGELDEIKLPSRYLSNRY